MSESNSKDANKVKVSDYVAAFLADKGIEQVFGLTGGAVAHLFDSLHLQDGIEPIFTHHEQAAAMAAVSYCRYRGVGACVVTTGPGGTNALTGLLGAWQDSIPCIFISGNARSAHMSHGQQMRQIGTQEFDIVSHVKDMTKHAVVVEKPESIGEVLETAWQMASTGRPGPVWVDIPLDIQWSYVEAYRRGAIKPVEVVKTGVNIADVEAVYQLLQQAIRPVFLIGYGVRLGHAEKIVRELIETLHVPVVCSWTGSDVFPSDHELNIGIPGISGQRGGNLAMQNSDLLIALGSHLCFPITGGNFAAFARAAKIVVVDVDPVELKPYTVRIDCPVLADVSEFSSRLLEAVDSSTLPDISSWREKCSMYKALNEVPAERYSRKDYVDPNVFLVELSKLLKDEPIAVDGGGTSLYASFQALKIHENQRRLCASSISAMGTGLPDAIGAAFASGKTVICTIGDGSMQLNIQELQTIASYNLPIKIIIMNNDGYLAIRHTQDSFLDKRHVGTGSVGGLSIPSYERISNAYGIPYISVFKNDAIKSAIDKLLEHDSAMVCEIFVSPEETCLFAQGFRERPDGSFAALPLENMQPLLPRSEFLALMEIDEWEG